MLNTRGCMFEAESEKESTRREVIDAEYLPTHDNLTALIPPPYSNPTHSPLSRLNAFTALSSASVPHQFHQSSRFIRCIVAILDEDDVTVQTA